MTRRAEEAETIKEEVEKVRDKAQALVNDIAKDKSLAEEKLEAARPALEEAEAALNTIKPAHIGNFSIIFITKKATCMQRMGDLVITFFTRT